MDSRPFVVGPSSKDREARPGRVCGGFARGYKLHAIASEDRRIPTWSVTELNVHDSKGAEALIDDLTPSALVLADSAYDTNKLYAKVASYNGQLLTAFEKRASGKGHVRQSPARLAAFESWKGIAGYVYRDRWEIRRWIGAKLIFYHARLKLKQPVRKAG
jgi:hypothetical protein